MQAVGRLAKRRPERASAASELPSPTRPVLTPEEHTDCALLPEEYARRASLLQRVRHANLLT
ncbi:hypothetical protein [Kitasatospora sp. GP82]|uniref:hypothetical protein n=1 Tax=Kitasatospora sp. GP82 TaxID=3035089 RepID=UPI002473991F|nr:hypothetical protein [Kitasatospora sp. GP82]